MYILGTYANARLGTTKKMLYRLPSSRFFFMHGPQNLVGVPVGRGGNPPGKPGIPVGKPVGKPEGKPEGKLVGKPVGKPPGGRVKFHLGEVSTPPSL